MKQFTDTLFVSIYVVLGLLLFILAAICLSYIPDSCRSNILRTSLTVTLIFSAVIITIAASYFACYKSGGKCYNQENKEQNSGSFHASFILFFSLCLMITMAVCGSELQKNDSCQGQNDDEKDQVTKIKSYVWFIFFISVLIFIGSSYMIYKKEYFIADSIKDLLKKR